MHKSSVKHPKMEDPKEPRENEPEQFPARTRQAGSDQPFQDEHVPQFVGKEYGEGNYKAAKDYDDATRDFVRSGRVEGAAKDAAPRTGQEARDLAEAEAQGRMRSKGEDTPAKTASSNQRAAKH